MATVPTQVRIDENLKKQASELFSQLGMFLKETGSLIMPDDEDDIEVFKYAEKLPVALNGYTNLYEYADICYTNMLVDINNDKLYDLYKTEGKVLEFY